jgi:hypothetical protein
MEFCKDGDLESYLTKNKKRVSLKEKEVIIIIKLFRRCNFYFNCVMDSKGFMKWELCIEILNQLMCL